MGAGYQEALEKFQVWKELSLNLGSEDSSLAAQRKFMTACGQTTEVLNLQQLRLYVGLVLEETAELVTAMEKLETSMSAGQPIHRDAIAEILDAGGDIMVVAGGVINSIGIYPGNVLDRVWATNLAKISPDGKVLRREDGKILKPPGWEPPIFTDLADSVLEPKADKEKE